MVDRRCANESFPLTYDELTRYIHQLEQSDQYVDKARLHWIQIGVHGLTVKARAHKLLSAYRGRWFKYWNANNTATQDAITTMTGAVPIRSISAAEAARALEANRILHLERPVPIRS